MNCWPRRPEWRKKKQLCSGKKPLMQKKKLKDSEWTSARYACICYILNFLSQLIFVFPLFLGMVMYANEFETKGKKTTTDTSILHRGECRIHREHHPCMNILGKKQATQTCRTPGETELIIVNDYSLTNTVFVYSFFFFTVRRRASCYGKKSSWSSRRKIKESHARGRSKVKQMFATFGTYNIPSQNHWVT